MTSSHAPTHGPTTRLPTVLLGAGLGGFFDGIVLHQILQWHHLLSAHNPPNTVANMELNTLADGLFHGGTWIVTFVGLVSLWSAVRAGASVRWSAFAGGLLTGWGAFNLIEGLIDHQILGIHHVRPGPDQLVYDIGFLIWGAAMVAAGIWLLRRSAGAQTDR